MLAGLYTNAPKGQKHSHYNAYVLSGQEMRTTESKLIQLRSFDLTKPIKTDFPSDNRYQAGIRQGLSRD